MRAASFAVPSLLIPLLLGLLLSACGPKNLKERTRHGEKLTDEASSLLDEAEKDLRNMDPDGAEDPLQDAQKLLSHPDVELSPESEMLRSRLSELRARVAPTREEKARRELEAAVDTQRDAIVQAMSEVSNALEAVERKDVGPAQVKALLDAVERTRSKLKDGKKLEARSEDYAASARRTEKRLDQATEKARSAQQVLDFVSGPATTRQEAEELLKKAKAEKDLDKQLALYTDARDRFQRCGETAKQLIAKTPELEKSPIQVAGQTTTPKAVVSGCGTRADSLQKTVARLEQAKAAREKKKNARGTKAKKG
jgi:predicted HAD superfamily phosphohydrolase